jgi:hypothetical protein
MIRWKHFRAEIAVLTASSFLGFVLSACSGPTQADIVGTYSRADDGVTETIEIRKDGSFEQTVHTGPGNHAWTLRSTWKKEPRGVTFSSFNKTYDSATMARVIPPKTMMSYGFFWSERMLIGDEEGKYIYTKDRP